MKLLYLYVRDGSYFNPMSVSFEGAYQFSYRESEKRVDLKIDETRHLGECFYSVVEDRKAKVDVEDDWRHSESIRTNLMSIT